MRCSLGRHREEATLQVSDDELVEVVLHDLADAIGLSVRPAETHVQRWGGALPQYAVGHLPRIASVRAEVAALPGLAVCGSAYDGVGIPACIASAHLAATKILTDLTASPTSRPQPAEASHLAVPNPPSRRRCAPKLRRAVAEVHPEQPHAHPVARMRS